jgi:hypothetical protein
MSVATIENAQLLRRAAQLAIQETKERAVSASQLDPVMAVLQAAEVVRLRTALEALVPGFERPTPDHGDATLNVM